jgi:hypothetical protein
VILGGRFQGGVVINFTRDRSSATTRVRRLLLLRASASTTSGLVSSIPYALSLQLIRPIMVKPWHFGCPRLLATVHDRDVHTFSRPGDLTP